MSLALNPYFSISAHFDTVVFILLLLLYILGNFLFFFNAYLAKNNSLKTLAKSYTEMSDDDLILYPSECVNVKSNIAKILYLPQDLSIISRTN